MSNFLVRVVGWRRVARADVVAPDGGYGMVDGWWRMSRYVAPDGRRVLAVAKVVTGSEGVVAPE